MSSSGKCGAAESPPVCAARARSKLCQRASVRQPCARVRRQHAEGQRGTADPLPRHGSDTVFLQWTEWYTLTHMQELFIFILT